MSDKIEVGAQASGEDGVNRLTSSIDQLEAALTKLGNTSATDKLAKQMAAMTKAMKSGFEQMTELLSDMNARSERMAEVAGARRLAQEEAAAERVVRAAAQAAEKKLRTQIEWEQKQEASGNKFHYKQIEAQDTAYVKQLDSYVKFWEKIIATQVAAEESQKAIQQRRDTEMYSEAVRAAAAMQALVEKRDLQEYESRAAAAAALKALIEKRDLEEYTIRSNTSASLQAVIEKRDLQEYESRSAAAAALKALIEKRDLEEYEIRARSNAALQAVIEKRDLQEYESRAAAAASLKALIEKRDLDEYTIRSRDAVALQALVEKRDMEEYTSRETAAARIKALAEKQQYELHILKEEVLARDRAIQEKRDMEEYTSRQAQAAKLESLAERQRVLNTGFLTASPASQLHTAVQAQTYAGLGGNAAERYGSEAASANVNALRRALESIPGAAGASGAALRSHNDIMNEGHALARGLAGSLGGLWLTYGSIVPLAAGAALASSLLHVVTVGKEVENQLNFVFALSSNREGVNLDQFLKINDSSLHSVVEAANAMRALAQNGLSASQSLQVLPSILDLATVGEMSVAQAALAATGATSAFGLAFSEAGRVGDIFAKTAAESNTSVLAITESMKQASTVASLFKVSIEETAGVLGVLAKINITGGAAGTSMTNMLTGLYEPTEKGKKALKELGLETQTTSGALKPFSVLMDELRDKLSKFNDSAKVDLLGSIFTVRGVKAVQQVQENLDVYRQKVDEASTATGFMRDVVMKLEDSTDGAFKRLGVTVQTTLVKAFQEASPYVQQIGLHLADAFGEKSGVPTALGNLATNIARATGFLLDHVSAIGAVTAAYLGYRILGPTILLIQGAMTATMALTAAQGGAALAQGVVTAANIAGAATNAMVTAAVEAQTAATVAATAASAAWSAVLLPALGAIAIAIAAAAAVWLVFRDNTDQADTANTKISNSLHVVTDQLDKEIKALEKANGLWDAHNGKYRSEAAVTPELVDQARGQVAKIEGQIRATGADPSKVRGSEAIYDPESGLPGYVHKYAAALADADTNLAKVLEKQDLFNNVVKPAKALKETRDATQQLNEELDKFYKNANARNLQGDFVQKDPAVRALYKSAADLASQLNDPDKKAFTNEGEAERIDRIRNSLKQLQDQVNSRQVGRAPKVDQKALNAQLGADLAAKQLEVELAKMDEKLELNSLKEQNRRGELGDLALINAELAQKLALNQKEVDVARQQYEMASAADKVGKKQRYEGVEAKAEKQAVLNRAAAEEARQSLFDKYSQEELKAEAKTLAAKGDLVGAFLKDYEAQYGKTVNKIIDDLQRTTDPTETARLRKQLDALTDIEVSGLNTADFQVAKQRFNDALAQVQDAMAAAKSEAQADGGLSGALGVASAANRIKKDLLPALEAARDAMKDAAKQTGSTAFNTEATKTSTSVSGITKQLAKDAQPFGDAWTKVWKDVEGAAHSAWMSIGQGGVSALDRIAKVLKTGILDMIYQLTVKKWMVQIGASITGSGGGGTGDAAALANAANAATGGSSNILSTGASLLSGGSALSNLSAGSGVVAQFASGLNGSAAIAAEALGAEMTTAAAAGSAISSTASAIMAAIPGWGWAMLGAGALIYAFGGDGPEDRTRIGFTSNNTPGNISINERGNEGRTGQAYIGSASTSSAFGTFGVSSSFWAQDQSKTVAQFLDTVSKTDNAFASLMTTAEKAQVSTYLTGKVSVAHTGHEGDDPNKNGELDGVYRERIHNIMEGLGQGLSALTDDFKGTSQELATETAKILQFRQALIDGGEAMFGMKVTLQQVAALKMPTEETSAALTRITAVFDTTNKVASITGSTAQKMFGTGLGSYDARNTLVQAAGGIDTLSKQIASYSNNFQTAAEKLAPAAAVVTKTMGDLGLASVKTKPQFDAVVRGLDLTNAADMKLFVSLMGVQQAFSDVASAADSAATGLQDQIDQLTRTRAELLQKERDALDPANRALFDQLQRQKSLASAKDALSTAYTNEVNSITSANTRLKSLGDSLRTFASGLATGANSPLTPLQKYIEAQSKYAITTAQAKAGDTKAQDALQGVAQTLLETSRVANASGDNYTADFNRVMKDVGDMASWADTQADIGKASLDALKKQVGGLIEIKDAVLTLPEALKNLFDQQYGDTKQGERNTVTDLYKELLGHAPALADLDAWVAKMDAGMSANGVADGIRGSAEYAANHAPAAYGQSDAEMPRVMAEMAAQIAALKEQVVSLEKTTRETGGYVAETVAAAVEQAAEVQETAINRVSKRFDQEEINIQ